MLIHVHCYAMLARCAIGRWGARLRRVVVPMSAVVDAVRCFVVVVRNPLLFCSACRVCGLSLICFVWACELAGFCLLYLARKLLYLVSHAFLANEELRGRNILLRLHYSVVTQLSRWTCFHFWFSDEKKQRCIYGLQRRIVTKFGRCTTGHGEVLGDKP